MARNVLKLYISVKPNSFHPQLVLMTGRSFHEYSLPPLNFRLHPCNNYQVSSRQSVWLRMVRADWKGRLLAGSFCELHTVAADLHPSSYWHNIDWLMISSSSPRFSPVSPPAPSLPSPRSPGVPWLGLVRSVNSNRIIPRITAGMFLQRKTLWKLWAGPVPCFQGQYFALTKKLTSDPL